MPKKKIKIVEVGPRDGLQNELKIVSTNNKIKYIKMLINSGIQDIEVTSFVNPEKIPQLSDAENVLKKLHKNRNIIFSALVPNLRGLERALDTKVKKIAIFTAASNTFNKKNINQSIDESLENYYKVIKTAKKNNLLIRGYISTCFFCPYEGRVKKEKVYKIAKKLLDMGVDELSIGDTTGQACPNDVYSTVSYLLKTIRNEKIALHFHDTYHMAVANVACGLDLGIRTFDSSSGGLGGCPYAVGASGNVATEDLVYFLDRMGYETNINLEKLLLASKFIKKFV